MTSKNPGVVFDKIKVETRDKKVQVNLADFLNNKNLPSLSICDIYLLERSDKIDIKEL